MAVVKIKAIRSTLGKAIGYITDGSKTNSGLMCSSNCSIVPGMAEDITANMELTLALADHSRRFGKPPSVVAYHVIQSFKPGEVDPNDAHDLGWEFAMAITKDEYDVVCATHLDRGHVHNHIIFFYFGIFHRFSIKFFCLRMVNLIKTVRGYGKFKVSDTVCNCIFAVNQDIFIS